MFVSLLIRLLLVLVVYGCGVVRCVYVVAVAIVGCTCCFGNAVLGVACEVAGILVYVYVFCCVTLYGAGMCCVVIGVCVCIVVVICVIVSVVADVGIHVVVRVVL